MEKEEEFEKEVVPPFLRFLTDPDDLDAGEFTHFVSDSLVCPVLRIFHGLHGSYFQIRLVAYPMYNVDAALGCTLPPISEE